jgi:transposase
VNTAEEPVLRKKLRRQDLITFFGKLPPTVVALEACGGSHHWARLLQSLGPQVKLIAPQLAKPYVKRGKNDAADAEAICEAMSRPTMRFVPVKTPEQQAALMLVGVRDRLIRQRTQLINVIRDYAAEFGLIAPKGLCRIEPLLERSKTSRPASSIPEPMFLGKRRPLLELGFYIAGEVLDAHSGSPDTLWFQKLGRLSTAYDLVDVFVELRDHIVRCTSWREDAPPEARLDLREARFCNSGHVWKDRRAALSDNSDRLANPTHGLSHRGVKDVDAASAQVGHRGCAALKMDEIRLDAQAVIRQQAGQMGYAANSGCGREQLLSLPLLLQRLDCRERKARAGLDEEIPDGRHADRLQILGRIEW